MHAVSMQVCRIALATLCAVLTAAAVAQSYPTAKTVSLVVAFPVGGGTDIVARMIADKMREAFKANVVVDNQPGASAQIGTKYVTDAAPDGYTLLVGTSSLINGLALLFCVLTDRKIGRSARLATGRNCLAAS